MFKPAKQINHDELSCLLLFYWLFQNALQCYLGAFLFNFN